MKAKADQAARLTWVKSSYSAGDGGQCVEVAVAGPVVFVRDSKQPGAAIFGMGADEWAAFVRMAARG